MIPALYNDLAHFLEKSDKIYYRNRPCRGTEGWPAEKYHSSYRLREDTCDELMTDVLRFVFLELGRFNKSIWQLATIFEKWMYLLKHIHEMTSIPEKFSEPLFKRLFMLAEIDKFTPEEKKQYIKSLENMGDFRNIINTAAEEAKQQGHAEGRKEAKLEDAKKLKMLGVNVEVISQATGLPVETIKEL